MCIRDSAIANIYIGSPSGSEHPHHRVGVAMFVKNCRGYLCDPRDNLRPIERFARSPPIGANQSTDAKLRTAPIAGDDHCGVDELAPDELGEDGFTR